MTNPYVFFVGCQRSGTTLVQHMIDSHPEIAVLPEGGWLGTWYEHHLGVSREGCARRDLVPRLLNSSKHVDLGVSPRDLYRMMEPEGEVLYADYISAVFDHCGKGRGKGLVGSKNPDYTRHLPTLRELWPEARFVHIYRDGRDVCLAAGARWADKPGFRGFPFFLYEEPDRVFDDWDAEPVITTGLWWGWHVRLAREFGRSLPPGMFHEIRYESLVADPEGESAALCDFLGLPFDDAMLRHHENFKPRRTGSGAVIHANVGKPVTRGLRDWRTQMEASDLERFEATAGTILRELDYPIVAADPPDRHLDEVERTRTRFEQLVATVPQAAISA